MSIRCYLIAMVAGTSAEVWEVAVDLGPGSLVSRAEFRGFRNFCRGSGSAHARDNNSIAHAVFVSGMDRLIAFIPQDGLAQWDVGSDSFFFALPHNFVSVGFSPSGTSAALMTSSGEALTIWRTDPWRQVSKLGLTPGKDTFYWWEFSSRDDTIATVAASWESNDCFGVVEAWNSTTGERICQVPMERCQCMYFWFQSYTFDGERVVVCGSPLPAQIFDVRQGVCAPVPAIEECSVASPHGTYRLKINRTAMTVRGDAADGSQVVHVTPVSRHPVFEALSIREFSPDNRKVLVSYVGNDERFRDDGAELSVYFWDFSKGSSPQKLPYTPSPFSPSATFLGNHAVVAVLNGTVSIYNIAAGGAEVLQVYPRELGAAQWVLVGDRWG